MKIFLLFVLLLLVQPYAYSQDYYSFKCSLVVTDETGRVLGEKMSVIPDETTEMNIMGNHLYYGMFTVDGDPNHESMHIGLLDYLGKGVLYPLEDDMKDFWIQYSDGRTSSKLVCQPLKNNSTI